MLLLIALAALTLPGCRSGRPLAFGGSNGHYIGEESIGQIKPGETDRTWVLAVFGRPTDRESLAGENEELWKYQYEFVSGNGSRAYLFNNRAEKGRTARYFYFQFSGNIVTKFWRD